MKHISCFKNKYTEHYRESIILNSAIKIKNSENNEYKELNASNESNQ